MNNKKLNLINSAIYGTINSEAIEVLRTQEFFDWFNKCSHKERAQVDARIARIENFNHFGDTRDLNSGLAELKWRSGRRIYFVRVKPKAILLLIGGYKNAQKKRHPKVKTSPSKICRSIN